MSVPPIRSERLELVTLVPEPAEALLAGDRSVAEQLLGAAIPADWPDEHDARFLQRRLQEVRGQPETLEWSVRALVAGGQLVGHAGFHGPPGRNGPGHADAVELGYTVFPPHRGRGYAQEAARALVAWAAAERGVCRFVASVAPSNAPSLAVVAKLGFVPAGEQWDEEDGRELVFELVVPQSGG